MPTTTLHLIRHAEPDVVGHDPALTELGRRQSADAARSLRSIQPKEILHGPARRSIERR